jgi:putative ABC transport system permease protein
MIKNYLKIAIRNLAKQKYFTTVNILGLAFGIAASVLIFLWVSHEMSYDKYHLDHKNIYRVTTDASLNGQSFKVCLVPSALAEEYADLCPEVEKTARTSIYFDQVFQYQDNKFKEEKVILADTGFFQLFHFTFLEGDPNKPFNNEESVVLTKSVAKRYFGNESALGKLLIIDQDNAVTVSAVIDDMPSNSHNQFDVALYFNVGDDWGNFNWMTYIKFIDEHSQEKAESALLGIVDNTILPTLTGFFGTTVEEFKIAGNYINLGLQPLSSIHLNSDFYGELEHSGNKTYVTFFSLIALFILIIAGINYMNLSTAYYDNRKIEVGIRKANGATPGNLLKQFLFESVVISCAAYLLGVILIQLILPQFVKYLDIEINPGMSNSGYFLWLLFIVVLLLGLISGLYPAAYLSRFKTTSILRNKLKTGGKNSVSLRSVLVIAQFSITIIVIVATLLIKKQVGFLLNKELGYNKEHLVVIEGTNRLNEHKEAFKTELKSNSQIESVCFSDTYPGENYNNITGYGVAESGPQQQYVIKTIFADEDYFDTYQMEMVHGRKFKALDRNAVVLNESAAKLLGLEADPLNHHILKDNSTLPIVGVVKNFHHEALNISLDPMIIRYMDNRYLDNAIVRLSGSNNKETIRFIENTWKDVSNNLPFEYDYLDNKIRAAYYAEMKAGKVFTIFSILSVLIACMGILGIASFLLQRRIKEIGIRKVNGAKTVEVMLLLNGDYIKWIAISFLIATPIAWYTMSKWLSNFAFKTDISWWIFIFAGILSLVVALATVSWKSLQAASRNPVDSLRYE